MHGGFKQAHSKGLELQNVRAGVRDLIRAFACIHHKAFETYLHNAAEVWQSAGEERRYQGCPPLLKGACVGNTWTVAAFFTVVVLGT